VYTTQNQWKMGVALITAIPESILSILLLLTTMRIYVHLNEYD
jgi:hypothetical protein